MIFGMDFRHLHPTYYREPVFRVLVEPVAIPKGLHNKLVDAAKRHYRNPIDHCVALLACSFEQADSIKEATWQEGRFFYRNLVSDNLDTVMQYLPLPDRLHAALAKSSRKRTRVSLEAEILTRLSLALQDSRITFLDWVRQSIAYPVAAHRPIHMGALGFSQKGSGGGNIGGLL